MKQAETTDYFRILCPDFPDWLNDYINTKELQTQKHISITCGTLYTDLFNSDIFYSSLDHSIAVALIVWHFTHDKKTDSSWIISRHFNSHLQTLRRFYEWRSSKARIYRRSNYRIYQKISRRDGPT